jgi:energy-converting hydrogenase Eha subunit A
VGVLIALIVVVVVAIIVALVIASRNRNSRDRLGPPTSP